MKESLEALLAQHPEYADRIRASFPEFFPPAKTHEKFELGYNKYKGTGKCWVAEINPDTKKIESFLDAESVEKRDNYSGWKTFLVPLVEGKAYQFRESGSAKNDSNFYRIVRGGELVAL